MGPTGLFSRGTGVLVAVNGAHRDDLEAGFPQHDQGHLLTDLGLPEPSVEFLLALHLFPVDPHDHVAALKPGLARRLDGSHPGDHNTILGGNRVGAKPGAGRRAQHSPLADQLVLGCGEELNRDGEIDEGALSDPEGGDPDDLPLDVHQRAPAEGGIVEGHDKGPVDHMGWVIGEVGG